MERHETERNKIIALNKDVFFGVRLKQLGHALRFEVELVPDSSTFLQAIGGTGVALGIIDINVGPDWSQIAAGITLGELPPILAFGPHLDVEGLRSAKAAGVTRIVSNGTFHRDAAALIARYASCGTGDETEI